MKKASILVLCVFTLTLLVSAADFTYVGISKCKMCHKGAAKGEVFEKWEKSPHANAFAVLKAKGEDKNPKCLECHVTGFNAGGYKVGDATAVNFEGVQCECCHGPGSAYKSLSIMKDKKQALANGLVEPNEALCKKCHNPKSPTFKGFNFAEAVKKINHSYRNK
jgi:hypothetical protein